ncbi:MAG TPA: glycosyltransferase [Blastocatellia bacterium]|nr:glycosyltransferase [Blastocatellia bacterium]
MHNLMRSSDFLRHGESPLRVLYFAPRECWPLDTGAKLRNFHLARELARNARVTYLGFSDGPGPAPSPHLSAIESACERVITVPRDRGYTLNKIVKGAVGRTPLPVLNYLTGAMRKRLASLLDEQDFDVVQVETVPLTAYLPVFRAARRPPVVVCDWHNIDSEVMWRYGEHTKSAARRLYARMTARRLEELERWAMREVDAHISVSNRDRARLLELEPNARVITIENGVDVEYYADEQIEQAYRDRQNSCPQSIVKRNRVVFVGSMDYHANVDAAVRFVREAWPSLREQRPGLVFSVVGRNPAPEVRALARCPGVEVTGTVDDVRPYYRDALAEVVPLRIGGGSRLKILEAMAAGVPVVSTRLGAEGLAVIDGRNILLADTPEGQSRAILSLSEDQSLRQHFAQAGRALVRSRYDWSAIGGTLFETHARLASLARAVEIY